MKIKLPNDWSCSKLVVNPKIPTFLQYNYRVLHRYRMLHRGKWDSSVGKSPDSYPHVGPGSLPIPL